MSFIAQMPQMQEQAAQAATGAMCGLVGGVAILTLIGAVMLRAACALYNKIAGGSGSSNSVPEPDFGWSLLICIGMVVAGFGIRISQNAPSCFSSKFGQKPPVGRVERQENK